MKTYFALLQYLHLSIGSLISRHFEKCHDLIKAGEIESAKIELAKLYEKWGADSVECMKCGLWIRRLELNEEQKKKLRV